MTDLNARQFLEEIAAVLREQGREVEITETEESFGTFVWMQSLGARWYDRTFTLSATRTTRTGRWALGRLQVGASSGGTRHSRAFVRHTRRDIRIAAEVYA